MARGISGRARHADLIESRHDLRPFHVVGENVVTAAGTDHHRCAGILVRCRSINRDLRSGNIAERDDPTPRNQLVFGFGLVGFGGYTSRGTK